MPWKKRTPMDERIHFISDYLKGYHTMQDLCHLYGISRKTGYKWIDRYKEDGADGLKEHSRRPYQCPHKTPYRIERTLIGLRKKYGWGPKKLIEVFTKRYPDWPIPARSTVCNILYRAGLIKKRRYRRHVPSTPRPFAPVTGINDVWSVDFKGQFKMGNGKYCYPLTVVDTHSRFLLACHCLYGPTLQGTKQVFEQLFRAYGLPCRIRSDNGTPFAAPTAAGLTRLSAWWIKLGISPERIAPGKPQQNGIHERMHLTLKQRAVYPVCSNLASQQRRFDVFQKEYNTIRPHEALSMKTPSDIYKPSNRPYIPDAKAYTYPSYFSEYLVQQNGCISYQGGYIYVSYLLHREKAGIYEVSYDLLDIYYCHYRIARYSHKLKKNIYPKT